MSNLFKTGAEPFGYVMLVPLILSSGSLVQGNDAGDATHSGTAHETHQKPRDSIGYAKKGKRKYAGGQSGSLVSRNSGNCSRILQVEERVLPRGSTQSKRIKHAMREVKSDAYQ